MALIIAAATPFHGHVQPVVTVAADLVVRAAGALHVALPPAADFDDRRLELYFPDRAAFPAGPAGPAQLDYDMKHVFGDPTAAHHRVTTEPATEPATAEAREESGGGEEGEGEHGWPEGKGQGQGEGEAEPHAAVRPAPHPTRPHRSRQDRRSRRGRARRRPRNSARSCWPSATRCPRPGSPPSPPPRRRRPHPTTAPDEDTR
ncbi:hypothetical protein [Streptomyces sp. NPDC051016]|uniref:hypothetical protein n=1 Tax=Streptomyces sp. NPDC051016 TaxID=3365638 RepID=UPI00379AD9B4